MLFNVNTCAVLALATGFAAAKPVYAPESQELPVYRRDAAPAVHKRGNNNGFDFAQGLGNFGRQNQVIDIQQENIKIVDDGRRQEIIEQAQQVVIVNDRSKRSNGNFDDLSRKTNFRNRNNDRSTVILVVQEIQVKIDDGRGNKIEENVFAQSAIVANRGRRASQTVMIFAAETLIAQNILGGSNGGQGIGQGQIVGAGNASNASVPLPQQTAGVQLFDAKPTWSSIVADPAATVSPSWQAEIQDAQNVQNNVADSQINDQAAAIVAKALGGK